MPKHQPNSPQTPYRFLTLLQSFIKNSTNSRKIKQIHSLIITNGHLHITSRWTNTLLYNSLIRIYCLFQPQSTFVLFRHMLCHNALPNHLTFPFLIKSSATLLPPIALLAGKPLGAQAFRRGVWYDPYMQTSFISLCAHVGDLESARKVFDEILQPNVVCHNAMIDAFGKNGDMNSAVLMFSGMSNRDVYSWTSLINGLARNERFGEALGFFGKMMVDGDVVSGLMKPTEATLVSVLSCCANLEGGKGMQLGKQVHGYMVKNERELSVFMGTALVAFYGKMDCFDYADRLFGMIAIKGVCTWNAMICSLALHCREKDAFGMFIAMVREGLSPNEITFIGLLSGCARASRVDLGMEIFHSMSSEYGIVPKMEHYGCVVDLLGRAGLLQEAYEFMENMPFKADASVLGALLGACRIHGATQMADEIGERILNLEPRDCGRYVQLSSIYAGAEKWDNAAALRRVMDDTGVEKIPAYSMIHEH
ncbi:OLC1v1029944C1 [Oldenlandia corymbosa var. corymbosa]|uniref:OLC1v1029944C1 n=1 Tax=Oldenlandia corymbosa var. corymbosa TaxID=529605 RepID=A0AAV1CI72_OLDCO|nr:OLC1v1029944C1 [Oldenlandia corymbosa var. corymbosa]